MRVTSLIVKIWSVSSIRAREKSCFDNRLSMIDNRVCLGSGRFIISFSVIVYLVYLVYWVHCVDLHMREVLFVVR